MEIAMGFFLRVSDERRWACVQCVATSFATRSERQEKKKDKMMKEKKKKQEKKCFNNFMERLIFTTVIDWHNLLDS